MSASKCIASTDIVQYARCRDAKRIGRASPCAKSTTCAVYSATASASWRSGSNSGNDEQRQSQQIPRPHQVRQHDRRQRLPRTRSHQMPSLSTTPTRPLTIRSLSCTARSVSRRPFSDTSAPSSRPRTETRLGPIAKSAKLVGSHDHRRFTVAQGKRTEDRDVMRKPVVVAAGILIVWVLVRVL